MSRNQNVCRRREFQFTAQELHIGAITGVLALVTKVERF